MTNSSRKSRNSFSALLPFFALFLLFPLSAFDSSTSSDSTAKGKESSKASAGIAIYSFKINKAIGPEMWRRTKLAVNKAIEDGYDLIFIEMNTYGGAVDAADSIRTKLLNCPIPVYVLIENNAASAGALISIACDSIFMMPGSTIGAATVVDQSGQPVPDKYQSYMRKKMRATAEETGRDPDMAEAMVDPDKYVEGISDSGKVLTFTTKEALKYGFCDAEAKTREEALKVVGIEDYSITEHKEDTLDKVIGWLINPAISGVLILVIIGGIYFELQTPGLGFPIVAATIAALMYFAPLYLEGLAENWEILVFVGGIVLLAIEIFAIPGFGVAGITGLFLMIFGLGLSLIGNIGFDFTGIPVSSIVQSFTLVIISSFVSLAGSIYLGAKLLGSHLFSRYVLNQVLSSSNEDDANAVEPKNSQNPLNNLIGKEGVAHTTMMPSGKVLIDDKLYNASAENGFVEEREKIKVTRVGTSTVFVRTIQ